MNFEKDNYIILEVIPTALTKEKGELIQLSAIKANGLKIVDRFDYRLNEDKIPIKEFLKLINYDKHAFTYKGSTEEILESFQEWSAGYPLLILDNTYTNNFLKDIPNPKESILKYLDKEYKDNIIDELIEENGLEPSNYIVDLLFESLIKKI
jgi:DNA polymerase-3 subunit alpha (Gram-positive type)